MRYSRAISLPNQSFFLFGARGTGKTSLLESALAPELAIELLSQEAYLAYASAPGLLRRQLESLPSGSWVWIDEVQRLPDLLNEVHWGIEKKKLKFALSGSSARKLRKDGINLLAGRALSLTLFPFLPIELGRDFNLESNLAFGSIPLIQSAANDQEKKLKLRAYVHSYLREEIQLEALVKDLPSFARFLKVASLLHGQTLSLSAVARDVGVKRSTVENYFSILQDTLLATQVSPLDSQLRVKQRAHPKFYWFDPGVVRALREDWGPIHSHDRGALFEGVVLNLLRAYHSYHDAFDEMSYWSSGQLEVDFVLKRNSRYCAIEVKSGDRFRSTDLKGLQAIQDLRGLDRRILVYPEISRQRSENGVDILSFSELSRELENGTLFKEQD